METREEGLWGPVQIAWDWEERSMEYMERTMR